MNRFLQNITSIIGKLSFKRIFIISCVFAFAIRISVAFLSGLTWYLSDTFNYLNQADAIINGRWIEYFPNGYSLIIAFVSFFSSNYFVHRDVVLVLLNVIFSSLVVGLTAVIVYKKTESKSAMLLAGLFVSLWPNQINYARQIVSEPSTTFFLILSIVLILFKKMWQVVYFLVLHL